MGETAPLIIISRKSSRPRYFPLSQTASIFTIVFGCFLALVFTLTAFVTDTSLRILPLPPPPPPPPPPEPELIEVTELPLPPVIASDEEGACTLKINPHGTGCMGKTSTVWSGNFLPDNQQVIVAINFTGAPAPPATASIYSGMQLIIIKIDDTLFPTGDPWKCLTCGIPTENRPDPADEDWEWTYPQAFHDGSRALVGTEIFDCSGALFQSDECTPDKMFIYNIRWNITPDGSGKGGSIRELRIHPDDVHLGFNAFTMTAGSIGQFAYFGRLVFNPSPNTGLPLRPRYELANVTRLFKSTNPAPVTTIGDQIYINSSAIIVGELRGFSGRGHEVTYIGYPVESCNVDVFAADLRTGAIRRLTSHPEYVDPISISDDDEWMVIEDTRGSGRQMFAAGMRYIPPIIDLLTTGVIASTRNNGQRRFFQPWIIDRYGDRGDYFGQQVNAAGDGSPGSVNDPQWNARADPKFSPDGTKIVYYQELTVSPACGGVNPLPCPNSTADGGRIERVMLARFPDRIPAMREPVEEASDFIPWGEKYVPGSEVPMRKEVAAGEYTLFGKSSGFANVTLKENNNGDGIDFVNVTYHDFSDDGKNFIVGTESVTLTVLDYTVQKLDWYSDLSSTGDSISTKKTSEDGFHIKIDIMRNIFEANGTLTTTVDGVVYEQPANGT